MMEARKTEFPTVPEHYRGYADDFTKAWREIAGVPELRWGPGDKARIANEARLLYENFLVYLDGFMAWAMPEHIRRLEKAGKGPIRYISGPWALRWLWEDYQKHNADPWQSQMTKEFFENG